MKQIIFTTLMLTFCIGPVFPQQWLNVGPYNGHGPIIEGLIQDTSNPQVLYAASNGEGIYKSLDKGDTWAQISQNAVTGQMSALAISPGNPENIYTGGSGGKIYKSPDGGNMWIDISGNLPAGHIGDIEIMPGQGAVYVAMAGPLYNEGGVFMTNNEIDWIEISQDFANKKVNSFEISPADPQVFFAATQQYSTNGILYKSLDGGITWSEVLDKTISDLKFDPNNNQKIVAAAESERIYRSEDNGVSWDYYYGFPSITDFLDVTFNSNNSNEMLVASQGSNYAIPGIYKSVNGGESWFGSDNGMTSRYVFSVLFDMENGQNAFCGSRLGFHKSADGGENWETSILGMKRLFVYSILINDSNPDHWIADTDVGMQITENQGQDWDQANGYCTPKIYLPGTDTVYGIIGEGSYSDGIYISNDDGYNWQVLEWMMNVTDLDVVNKNPSTLYVISSGSVGKSVNGGLNWSAASSGINEDPVLCLEIDQNHPDTIFAITSSKVWKTIDGAVSWAEIPGPFADYNPLTLTIDPQNTEQIYIGANEVLITSTNGGTDWTVESLPCSGLRTIALSPVYEGVIFTGFDTEGIYISLDQGLNWTEMNEGLNNKTVNCMSISPGSDFLLCGTHGDAIFKADISFVGAGVAGNIETKSLNIFPVPAKDKVYININYEFESIEIYNINGELQIISHQKEVVISELSRGIYFVAVVLANGRKIETKKIVKL